MRRNPTRLSSDALSWPRPAGTGGSMSSKLAPGQRTLTTDGRSANRAALCAMRSDPGGKAFLLLT
jgi:hypothetical protein